MKVIYAVVFAIFMASFASAATSLNIYLDDIGDALFLGITDENITLPDGVKLENGKISGYTSNLTRKEGEMWTFSYTLIGSELKVVLPENAVIKKLSGGEIFLEKKQIAIQAKDRLTVSYVIEKNEDGSAGMILLWILGLLAAAVIIVYILNYGKREKRQKKNEVDELSIVAKVLNDREKLIIEKLKKEGKIKSSYLRKLCDIPKASFSRHIRELEKKKLVKFSGEGRNKFVALRLGR